MGEGRSATPVIKEKIEHVREISLRASAEIKTIVMGEVGRLKDKFPKIIVGVREKKYLERPASREDDEGDSAFGRANTRLYAVEKEIPGIVLREDNRFWTESLVVMLTPLGLFQCGKVMSESANTTEPRRKGYSLHIGSRPDWDCKEESGELWMKHAERALELLQRLQNE